MKLRPATIDITVSARVIVPCFHPGCTSKQHAVAPEQVEIIDVAPIEDVDA